MHNTSPPEREPAASVSACWPPRGVNESSLGLPLTPTAAGQPRASPAVGYMNNPHGFRHASLHPHGLAVSQYADDPYFAQNLQRWEQGRFIHFHGIGQWLAWMWPYAAMLALFAALARRQD